MPTDPPNFSEHLPAPLGVYKAPQLSASTGSKAVPGPVTGSKPLSVTSTGFKVVALESYEIGSGLYQLSSSEVFLFLLLVLKRYQLF